MSTPPTPPVRRITLGPRCDLVYGRSGSTKTTQAGRMAEYIYDKHGQRTRLVTADPGGYQAIEHLVAAGIVEPYMLTQSHRFPLETLMRLAQGWWPNDPSDPNAKLGPPPPSGMGDVGAYAFEGMSTFSTLLMSNLVGRTDIHIPETPKESFVKDDQLRWGFSGRAHYGFIQQRIYEVVSTTNHLSVHKVLWTAHETDAKDTQARKIFGPAIIGEAMTGSCGAWFGAMLHLHLTPKEVEIDDPVNKGKKVKIVKRVPMMYLREHIDPDDPYRTPYAAKPRGPYSMWTDWPDAMEPDLYKFYEQLDAMGERAVAQLREKAAKAAQGGTQSGKG